MRRGPLLLALAGVLSACGGTVQAVERHPLTQAIAPAQPDSAFPASDRPQRRAFARPRTCDPGGARKLRSRERAYAGVVQRRTTVFDRPRGTPVQEFGVRNVNDFPTVLGVLAVVVDARCQAAWYKVQLPVRPNGATGYVRADDVTLTEIRTRIVVDLSERRIDVFRRGSRVLRLTAAVGSPSTPTPTGSYYVNQRLESADPAGPYGPAALGISGFSPVLTGWAQGGPIAIHGTNEPWSIGKAASNGCLRIDNDALRRLYPQIPAGTPVEIRA